MTKIAAQRKKKCHAIQHYKNQIKNNTKMPHNSTVFNETNVSLSFTTYLRHYKFRLEEFLKYGLEEFDNEKNRCFTKPLLHQSKLKIQAEIEMVDLLLKSIINYNKLKDNR